MEILSNFSSIYCFITFIIGAVFMLMAICIVAMGKEKEPSNKVRFYVEMNKNDKELKLYIQIIHGYKIMIAGTSEFKWFGLNPNDFADMKEGEIREVFVNLEN